MTSELIFYNSTLIVEFQQPELPISLAHDKSTLFYLFFTIFKVCLTTATVLLNCLVIWIISRLNKKKSFSNYLFLSSAIADLIIGVTAEPFMIIYSLNYRSSLLVGENSCFYWLILNNSCLFLNISLFNLLITTIHRYNQVKSALVHDKPTNFRYVLIFLVWILSSAFWLLMIIPIVLASQRTSLFECNYVYSAYIIMTVEFFTLVTPIALIVIFNILTYYELKNKAIKMKRIKLVKKFESQFRTFNNRILSNSDNCLDKNLLTTENIDCQRYKIGNPKRSFNLK
jgi:hypothetical protein